MDASARIPFNLTVSITGAGLGIGGSVLIVDYKRTHAYFIYKVILYACLLVALLVYGKLTNHTSNRTGTFVFHSLFFVFFLIGFTIQYREASNYVYAICLFCSHLMRLIRPRLFSSLTSALYISEKKYN